MKIVILGAGSGACAAAVDLTLRGFTVSLYSRSETTIEPLQAQRGVQSVGGVFGREFVPVPTITCDVEEAVAGAEVFMVTVPAHGHRYYASLLAPYVSQDTVVLLHPGHTGGALGFVRAVRRSGSRGTIKCCEMRTLAYVAQKPAPHQVTVFGITSGDLGIAAFPGKYQPELVEVVKEIYPAVEPRQKVLETGLSNLNAVLHPAVTLLNAGWIEHTAGQFRIYSQGMTPAVGAVMEAVDGERLAIADAYALGAKSLARHFYEQGTTTEEAFVSGSAYRVVKESPSSRRIKAPSTLDHRFLHEDVGCGLVPMSALGNLVGVGTPNMEALIRLASLANGTDYASSGRTLDRMGLSGISMDCMDEFLYQGVRGLHSCSSA